MRCRNQSLTPELVRGPEQPRMLGARVFGLTRWVLALSTFASWLRCSQPTETDGTPLLASRPLILRKSSFCRIGRPATRRTSRLKRLCANIDQKKHPSPIPKRTFMYIAREVYMRFSIPTGSPTPMFPTSSCFLIHAGIISVTGPSNDDPHVLSNLGARQTQRIQLIGPLRARSINGRPVKKREHSYSLFSA
jgi:hypothetical protein